MIAPLYALKVEPYRLTVNGHRLNEPSEGSEELRIVQLSDIHIKPEYTVDQLKRIVDRTNDLAPDLIVFTGDLYDRYNSYRDDENVVRELRRLRAWTSTSITTTTSFWQATRTAGRCACRS